MQDYIKILEKIGTKKTYQKDNILFYEGEKAQHFFLLLAGKVRVFKSLNKFKERHLHFFTPVSFIAEMPAFKGINYPASGICESKCEILEFKFKDFEELCKKDIHFAFMMIASLFEKINILEQDLRANSLELKEKLKHFLILNEKRLEVLTQRQIASELNTPAQSLSRVLKELKNEGFLSTQKGKILLLKQDEI